MNVWRLNIKPDSDPGTDPRQFCFDRGILGAGWPIDTSVADAGEYRDQAREKYGDGSWQSFFRAIHSRMEEGDLCWSRDLGGIYYLGRVVGPWRYETEPAHVRADVVNVRDCDWVEVGEADAVPGKVVNSFRGRTLQRVKGGTVETFSRHVYSKNCPDQEYELDGSEIDLFRLLGPMDCEDVVGAYLQEEGYRLAPSTCKKNTPQYEYVLRGPDGQKTFVQVKQGKQDLSAADYEHLDGEVYLFTTHGEYRIEDQKDIYGLKRSRIESFIYDRLSLLSERVQNWVEIHDQLLKDPEN